MAYTTASSAELEEEFKSQFGMSISEIQAPSASAEPEPDDVPDTWPAKPFLENPKVILVDVHTEPEEETVVSTEWLGAVSCRVTAYAMEVIRKKPLGSYVEIDQGATHYMVGGASASQQTVLRQGPSERLRAHPPRRGAESVMKRQSLSPFSYIVLFYTKFFFVLFLFLFLFL
jgi:hypothetical protein